MSNSGRPLLAARLSDETPVGGASPASGGKQSGRPKRTLIESACSACRRRKSRCDGLRPSCSRCQNLRTDCQYEAEEGESRWSALRRRNQVLECERDQVRELLAFVQTRPEPEAMDIFQRLRSTHYDDVFMLLRQIKENAMGMPPGMSALQAQGVAAERLPPIQAILDVPGRGITPVHPHLTQSHSLSSEDSRGSSGPDLAGGHPQHRPHLDTLEPSLHPQHQQHQHQHGQQQQQHHMGTGPISYNSEESSASNGSTTMDAPRPYHTP